jgi:CO/xanthine dehydrogenase Mo-binding subunit
MRAVYVGGMFGVVGRPERFSVLLALKTGRPVKIVYSREDCFIDGLNRLPKLVYIKDGVKRDGTLVAREMKIIVNTGAYTDHAPIIIRNGAFHASQYRMPHFKWDAYGVYTNEPGVAPLRGFGSAEVLWATEQQMDIAAEKLGMDPLEYRLKNTPDEGEINVRGEIVHSTGAKECLRKAAEWIKWDEPSEQPANSKIRRGKGIALGNKYTMSDTASTALVKVYLDGTIEVYHGTDECGQGCNTVFTQIAAEEFDVPLEKVRIVWGDTTRVPYDFGSASSRSTMYVGNAIRLACNDAKRQMFEIAAPILETQPENLDTREGRIFLKSSPDISITFADLSLSELPEATGVIKTASCLAEGGQIIGKATFWGRPGEEDHETGRGQRLAISYCYGAQAVEAAVDVETGTVKILRFCSAFDTGVPVNPKMVEGQMEGGAGMGIGSALYEGFLFNDKGQTLNPNFNDYRLPSAVEVPSGENMASIIVEAPHREGPFGAKGMGEAAMNPTAPAVANAIYNAIGVRLHRIPMTPERVLHAIKEYQDKY